MEFEKLTCSGSILPALMGRLIVSCQAPDGDPFRSPGAVARFAQAAVAGGAAAIRVNSPEDVRSVRSTLDCPVIGLHKRLQADGKVLITPSFEDAAQLAESGAHIIAVDCTIRGVRAGALERLRRIRAELGVPVLADIATLEEAVAAAEAGADLVASTMRGYTDDTASVRRFEPEFIRALVARLKVPVLAEGRIQAPEEAADAIAAGAHAVIVGTAITRPQAITARFAAAIEGARITRGGQGYVLGIDLGGTNTKAGLVSPAGEVQAHLVMPTPAKAGRAALLEHLHRTAERGVRSAEDRGLEVVAIGVATAGWVDPAAGRVAWATDNLAEWTGAPICDYLVSATGLRVAVEGDANAMAIAEGLFGAARGLRDYVSLTLGTGVGGGFVSNGHLIRGAHGFGGAIGHLSIELNGIPCNCGKRGCLEVYANAAALQRYAANSFPTAADTIQAAYAGDAVARRALTEYAGYLIAGIACIIQLLDPELVLIAGGLAQNNEILLAEVNRRLAETMIASGQRRVRVRASGLGYHGGVLGAAAAAMDHTRHRG